MVKVFCFDFCMNERKMYMLYFRCRCAKLLFDSLQKRENVADTSNFGVLDDLRQALRAKFVTSVPGLTETPAIRTNNNTATTAVSM